MKIILGTITLVVLAVIVLTGCEESKICPEGQSYGLTGTSVIFNGKTSSTVSHYGCR